MIDRCEKIEAKLPEEQAPVEDVDGENNLLAVLEKMNVQNKNPQDDYSDEQKDICRYMRETIAEFKVLDKTQL